MGKEASKKHRKSVVATGGKALNCSISVDAVQALSTLCDRNGWTQREAVENALVALAGVKPTDPVEDRLKRLEHRDAIYQGMFAAVFKWGEKQGLVFPIELLPIK